MGFDQQNRGQSELPYMVGALLYAPATNDKILRLILEEKCGVPYSASLCLEDSIQDAFVPAAEEKIVKAFAQIDETLQQKENMKLPLLFIRVRCPEQIPDLYRRLGNRARLLTGFIAPKYSPLCAEAYNLAITRVNAVSSQPVYLMPTLESKDIVKLESRRETLCYLRESLDSISRWVLNVRVGGNDFCNAFGLRRSVSQTIYDILPVASILSDILTCFSSDYVVSGPVWEYFAGEDQLWKTGLMRELELDRLNGFIGKTVIHPCQIPLVNQSLQVSKKDLEDAESILNWTQNNAELVEKNRSGERMNEKKVHTRWAEKIRLLAKLYGVKE